jgi:hypothetical protein
MLSEELKYKCGADASLLISAVFNSQSFFFSLGTGTFRWINTHRLLYNNSDFEMFILPKALCLSRSKSYGYGMEFAIH